MNALFFVSILTASPLFFTAPATAQATAKIDAAAMVGKSVVDPQGNAIGTVIAAKDGMLIVKTDSQEATLPPQSFTFQQGKLYFGMTRAQLNAEIVKAKAKSDAAIAAALSPGGVVKGSAGNTIGTIAEIDADFATIKLTSGKSVKIPRSGIAGTPDGAIIGMTAEALEAQVASGGR